MMWNGARWVGGRDRDFEPWCEPKVEKFVPLISWSPCYSAIPSSISETNSIKHTDLSHFLGETVISRRNTVVWIWLWKNLNLFGRTYNWQVANKSCMQQYQLPIAWYLPQWSIPLDSDSSLNLNMFGEENHSKNIVFPSDPKGIPKVTKNTVPD